MKNINVTEKVCDWEEFGYKTTIECLSDEDAIEICGHELHAYETQLQPNKTDLGRQLDKNRHHANSLHEHLYGRPIPASDASMLVHRLKVRSAFILALLMFVTSAVSNFVMFWLIGWGMVSSIVAAIAITTLPLGLGHLLYEKLVSHNRGVQLIVLATIGVLMVGGVYEFGQSRKILTDKAVSQSTSTSYVEGAHDFGQESPDSESGEAKFDRAFGESLFLISLAAELGVGFFMGLFAELRTDEDFAAWQKLHQLDDLMVALERRIEELGALIEIAKKQCTVGIRRAQSVKKRKRKTPYFKGLLVISMFGILLALPGRAQVLENEEGELIDTSVSIARGGDRDLFQEYLRATKQLLATEPPNTRVWVSTIAINSFGGTQELLRGWTPQVRGVFRDNLIRARHDLATSFEAKSAALSPVASGTDIFGALWRAKAIFESSGSEPTRSRSLWLLSDMVNETPDFPMPKLLSIGSERMFERAKANGLVVPLSGYKIHVYGASTAGLTPQAWKLIRRFWELYFRTAGAELVTYSAECDVQRSNNQ